MRFCEGIRNSTFVVEYGTKVLYKGPLRELWWLGFSPGGRFNESTGAFRNLPQFLNGQQSTDSRPFGEKVVLEREEKGASKSVFETPFGDSGEGNQQMPSLKQSSRQSPFLLNSTT